MHGQVADELPDGFGRVGHSSQLSAVWVAKKSTAALDGFSRHSSLPAGK